jgi:hypothetical protein
MSRAVGEKSIRKNDLGRRTDRGQVDLTKEMISKVFSKRTTQNTLSPFGAIISGNAVVLQTLWRMVVLPAFARPTMRIRKRRISLRIVLAHIDAFGSIDE